MRLIALVLALAAPTSAWPAPLWSARFTAASESEAVLELTASCQGCSWGRRGREAAVPAVELVPFEIAIR